VNEDRLRDLLRYRMRQADDSLREAGILRDADAQRGAVNRAYYAMFYALLALLATKQLGTSRHSGAISLFDAAPGTWSGCASGGVAARIPDLRRRRRPGLRNRSRLLPITAHRSPFTVRGAGGRRSADG
jgi:hypothetical protein